MRNFFGILNVLLIFVFFSTPVQFLCLKKSRPRRAVAYYFGSASEVLDGSTVRTCWRVPSDLGTQVNRFRPDFRKFSNFREPI